MTYKVTSQYPRASEREIGQYKDIAAAKAEIQDKLAYDASLKIKVIYRLYDDFDVIEIFDPDKIEAPTDTKTSASQDSQGQGARHSGPTPFNTAPRPAGIPRTWGNADDKKDKE